MPALAGVDGCRGGWVAIVRDGAELEGFVAPDVPALAARLPAGTRVAIDMAIGLSERGDRACCRAARSYLGRPRASSVFAVPVRGVLGETDYGQANARHRAIDGRGLSRQAFALLDKLRDLDTYVRHGAGRVVFQEIHPELSFAAWAGAPMRHGKRHPEGRAARERLIEGHWPGHHERLWRALRGAIARDDLNDAWAALWTAERLWLGTARFLPAQPPLDACGLAMQLAV